MPGPVARLHTLTSPSIPGGSCGWEARASPLSFSNLQDEDSAEDLVEEVEAA